MELFKNKNFLYFVAFFALANVVGMIHQKQVDLLLLFVIIGFFTFYFTKNMTYVLLSALLITNLTRAIYSDKIEITKFI